MDDYEDYVIISIAANDWYPTVSHAAPTGQKIRLSCLQEDKPLLFDITTH